MTQRSLFEMRDAPAAGAPEVHEAWNPIGGEGARRRSPAREAVSSLANLPLHEMCATCGREVGAEGCIIPDFEELGTFCGQECAGRRFRLYLEEEPDEDELKPDPKEKVFGAGESS